MAIAASDLYFVNGVVAAATDDVEIQNGVYSNNSNFPRVGKGSSGVEYKVAVRFPLKDGFDTLFWLNRWLDDPTGLQMTFGVESAADASAITDLTDYNSRTRGTWTYTLTVPDNADGVNSVLIDITDAMDEVKALSGWTDGDYIQFFMEPAAAAPDSVSKRWASRNWSNVQNLIYHNKESAGGGIQIARGMHGGIRG